MGYTASNHLRSLVVLWTVAALIVSGCHPFQAASELAHIRHRGLGTDAMVCECPTVEALAHDLDKLEAHIERYGSVVAKQPDVWGQARLTKHRQEFETQMAGQLSNFDMTLQGSVAMSDQAYFVDALALSAAAAPRPRGRGSVTTSSSSSSSTTETPSDTEPNLPLPEVPDAFGAFSEISRTKPQAAPALQFATKGGITIEPAVLLDQRARFLNHLQELRRINEGDDTSDAPGYALNLVRIPVSVLPGKHTDIGYGAEITITMTPYLSDELLPTTFRNLVMNDVVDQLGFPITEFINNKENAPYFEELSANDVDTLISLLQQYTRSEFHPDTGPYLYLKECRWKPGLQALFARPEWSWVDTVLKRNKVGKTAESNDDKNEALATDNDEFDFPALTRDSGQLSVSPEDIEEENKAVDQLVDEYSKRVEAVKQNVDTYQDQLQRERVSGQIPIPSTKSRRARLAYPPSELFDVFGFDFDRLTIDAFRGLAKQKFSHPTPDDGPYFYHLPDVQGYLQEELAAAYKFLEEKENVDLWMEYCTPELVNAVRGRRTDELESMRLAFKRSVAVRRQIKNVDTSTMGILAWAVIVESALLTDQLIEDMRESAVAKNCCPENGAPLPYFLPDPPVEAREAFKQYVQCRWPIHVFALDPASQQQNIVDLFSGRREMQLAMSMAFVSGRLSANNMMRYARRIEYDFATIDLNGTEIGFSHGDDTFGWRFYPRFQTPDIESNATVLFRDLLIGGPNKNALLKQRRLEPGIRECYAIVIMPSFVPYATFSVSSNWFSLTNPKCKQLDSTDAMRLSKLVKQIQTCGPNTQDGECYRDCDLQHLLGKAKQLETRLPFQSTMVQIPYENTLGGFAMFNTGVTDLAPELTGWYGTEAIDPNSSTTLFLVGNHFSVHQTKVIAGGQAVSDQSLLSRQVMQVTIPKKPLLVGDKNDQFVDVQLATPYGITQHLLIPVQKSATGSAGSGGAPSANDITWKPANTDLAFVYAGLGIVLPPNANDPNVRPPNLVLTKGTTDTAVYDQVDVTLKFPGVAGAGSAPIPGNLYNDSKGGYVVPGEKLAAAVLGAVGPYLGPQATTPVLTITATATLKFKSSLQATTDKDGKVANDLTIKFYEAPKSSGK